MPINPKNTFVSVVVPVYNQSLQLKLCLQSLERQTYPSDLYEVIVVDNDSSENIREICRDFKHVIYHYEKKPGCAPARNAGIRQSAGQILAFTDADCIVDERWIESAVQLFKEQLGCQVYLGGKVIQAYPNNSQTVWSWYDEALYLRQDRYLRRQQSFCHANFFVYRDVFMSIGMLDEEVAGLEDLEWSFRARQKGLRPVYAEKSICYHQVVATSAEFFNRARRFSQSMLRMRRKNKSAFEGYFAKRRMGDIWEDIFVYNKDMNWVKKFSVLCVVVLQEIFIGWENMRLKFGYAPGGDEGYSRIKDKI